MYFSNPYQLSPRFDKRISLSKIGILEITGFLIVFFSVITRAYSVKIHLFLLLVTVTVSIISYLQDDMMTSIFYSTLSLFVFTSSILKYPFLFPVTLLILYGLYYFKYTAGSRYIPTVVQYSLPEDLRPAEAAFLISRDIGPQELIATIFDLARRGYLEINKSGSTFVFRRLKDYTFDKTLLRYEKFILDRIFIGTNIDVIMNTGIVYSYEEFASSVDMKLFFYNLSEWKNIFKEHLIESMQLEKPILKGKIFETKPTFLSISILFFILGLFFLNVDVGTISPLASNFWIPLLVTSVIAFGFAFIAPLPETEFGVELERKARGFREFLKRVEYPRLKWLIMNSNMDVLELAINMYALNLLRKVDLLKMLLKEGELKEEVKHFLEIYFTVQSTWAEFRMKAKP